MKVLIVSDTHGNNDNFKRVIEKTGQPDFLIHAGDTCGGEYDIIDSVVCPVKMVCGNNDFTMRLNREEEFDLDEYRVLLTHGHTAGVYYGTDRLFYKASECGADIVIYGHTHIPSIEYDEDLGIWAINPGSLSYPRQEGRRPSYIIMDTEKSGASKFQLHFL